MSLYQPIPTIVIDNFFETPSVIRQWALSLDYFPCKDHPAGGNWPGVRAAPLMHHIDYEFHQRLASKLIQYVPGKSHFETLDVTFHVCTEEYESGWIHRDDDDFGIGGLIYLNPENPQGCGTSLYDVPHNDDSINYEDEFKSNVHTDDPELRSKLNSHKDECNKHFIANTTIEARYNRCIIFDGRKYHSGGKFFGKDINDGRLTLLFFGRAV